LHSGSLAELPARKPPALKWEDDMEQQANGVSQCSAPAKSWAQQGLRSLVTHNKQT